MNSILDQQEQEQTLTDFLNMALSYGYVRRWKDTDGEYHYELTEKGVKRLATLMV